jgi:putative transcriptional regulator
LKVAERNIGAAMRGRSSAANREQLIQRIRDTLSKCGFYLSDPHTLRSISFDIVARRDRQLLMIKALCNIDSLSEEDAGELKLLCTALGASPMVIGLHSSSATLEDGILYSRFGIPIVSEKSFDEFLMEGVPPFVYAAPGGLYVRIDGEMLRSLRQARSISLGRLAEAAGVSRKAIQMYESGMGAMVDIAARIEDFLNEPIVMPLDPFRYTAEVAKALKTFEDFEGLNKDIFEMLNEIGYSVVPTRKAPFEAIASEDEFMLLTGIGQDPKATEKKAKVVGNISRVTEKRSVVIIQKKSSVQAIDGTPLVTKDELRRADDADDLLELILKREKRPRI